MARSQTMSVTHTSEPCGCEKEEEGKGKVVGGGQEEEEEEEEGKF